MDLKREEIVSQLKRVLSPKRFRHTLGVEETALKLANIYNINEDKACYAALLHDCAKELPLEKVKAGCLQYQIDLTLMENYRQIVHSFLGAKIAENEYDIWDSEIIDAIRYHTTGRANMSLLEKIIFISDYIEPNRRVFSGLEEIRELTYNNLDGAVLKALKNTILYLEKGHKKVHPLTREAKNYLANGMNTGK